MSDDGRGPYTFCKRGISWCNDQFCNCVDSAKYRAMYLTSRGQETPRTPWWFVPYVIFCAASGVAVGFAIVASFMRYYGGGPLWAH